MNAIFRTNVTTCVDKGSPAWAWDPQFLDTGTLYWVETKQYEPESILIFKAWYYQVGGEYNTFKIQKQDNSKTRIAVDQAIKFFITFPYCGPSESKILDDIESDLKPRK